MKSHFKEIKALPEYLQPKILSAVAFVNSVAPNLNKAVERINTLQKHLTDKEVMWVMSLLTFEKLLDIVKDSKELESYSNAMKERTIQ
jgi:cell division protein ZapA (FtsZ GTPase activity inhibitor)